MNHLLVNIDKGEYLDPHAFGEGRNLSAFARGSSLVGAAVLWMLRSAGPTGELPESVLVGRWSGDRVVVAAEQCPSGLYLPDNWLSVWREKQPQGSEFGEKPNLYRYAEACLLDVSLLAVRMLAKEPAMLETVRTMRRAALFDRMSKKPLSDALIELSTGASPPRDSSPFELDGE